MNHVIKLNQEFETSQYCQIDTGDIIMFECQPTGTIKALATTYNINSNSCRKCVFRDNRCPVFNDGRISIRLCRLRRLTMVFQDLYTILEHI